MVVKTDSIRKIGIFFYRIFEFFLGKDNNLQQFEFIGLVV